MENLRRRTEREIADTRAYAVANFARDMLVVGDNLTRAIAAVPPEARDGRDPALNALIEGVEVTERGLAQTLQKFGVKLIEAKGAEIRSRASTRRCTRSRPPSAARPCRRGGAGRLCHRRAHAPPGPCRGVEGRRQAEPAAQARPSAESLGLRTVHAGVARGVGPVMVDVARIDPLDRQHDQYVGRAELAVDDRVLADLCRRGADSP